MDCQQLLSSYTEYRDGLLDAESAAEVEIHLSTCLSCRRYQRVVDEGVRLLRALPPVEAGEDFVPRLKHRIYHLEDGDLVSGDPRRSGVTAFAAVGLTLLMTAAAWSPVLRHSGATVDLPAIVVSEPPATAGVRSEPQLPRSAFFRAKDQQVTSSMVARSFGPGAYSLSTVSAASRQRSPALLGSALLGQPTASRYDLLRDGAPKASDGGDGAASPPSGLE